MKKVFGPRTAVEAVVLVAVPVVALSAGQTKWAIIAEASVAYLIVLAVEIYLGRGEQTRRAPIERAAPPAPLPETVRVLPPAPAAEPEPIPATVEAPELAPEADPEPEPEPAPVAPRVLQPVPDPEPEPAPVVVSIGAGASPREWNLWDLERLSREHAGHDDVRDEERSFLLMYLRDFAGPDGLLPIDFDGLVRDSFGDLVGAR